MKNYIVFFTLVLNLIFVSCNKNDSLPIEHPEMANTNTVSYITKAPSANEYYVSVNDARKFADAIRPGKTLKIEPYVVEKDTLLYFINYDEGWMILAGDKRLNPFVAESENGDISMPTSNESLNVWIDSYADEIRVIRTVTDKKENEFTELWSKISQNRTPEDSKGFGPETKSATYKWAVVSYTYCDSETYSNVCPHLLTTEWGQGDPWNTKLPVDTSVGAKCPTGCTAVAIAQILYYMHYEFNKPLELYHNISVSKTSISGKTENIGFARSDKNANSTRWDQMALMASSLSGHSYVGDLMLDVGNRVEMEYSGGGSSASISQDAMNHYGISYEESDFDYQIVKADIINSKPVKVTAYRNTSNGLAGHAWVIDGIAQRTRHFVTEKRFEYTDNWMHESEYYESFDDLRYRYNINDEFDVVVEEGGTSVTDFLLMNWGYDGAYNDDYFSTYPSTAWTIFTDRNYEYDKTIYYDFN